MLEIRPIGPAHAEALAALWTETFTRAYADLHAREDLDAYCAANCTAAKARAMLEDAAIACKVAHFDGSAVGYATVRDAPCPVALRGKSVELKQLYILPDVFGAGVGRALMEDALETARAHGAAHMWLCVVDINKRGPPFYRKFGFDYVGPGPTFEVGKDRVASRTMARDL
ncbi:MAG: GNAT family N-acetyltransferase [Hyphomonadaceae bacterium]|nr:GNAT family N-acetyltransferase [Hyphomonadaceae bacterium]